MSTTTLTCGQAIFTSVRTPMGEGYRIIAASRTIRPEEKQTITRYSPSHDALCVSASDASAADRTVAGVAFYPLSSERLCVALTVCAGTEHTGRGGKRVYTHNVVFARIDFQKWAYNPFNVLRAMIRAGVTTPQLKPPPVLEELQLLLDVSPDEMRSALSAGAKMLSRTCLSSAFRRYVLQGLLDGRSLVVKLDGGWLESAEAWLMGVPGPMRWELSFGAGLKFSVGRCHRLQLVSDHTRTVKRRVAGQPLEYVDPTIKDEPAVSSSAWLSLVDHHWSSGDIAALAGRTSRPFDDTSPQARERIARLYRSMDAIPGIATDELLAQVLDRLNSDRDGKGTHKCGMRNAECGMRNVDPNRDREGAAEPNRDREGAADPNRDRKGATVASPLVGDAERELQGEFLSAVQRALTARFATAPWVESAPHWPTIVAIRRSGGSVASAPRRDSKGACKPTRDHAGAAPVDAVAFAGPLIEQLLRTAMKDDPLAAAEAALDVASLLVGDDVPGHLPSAARDPDHLALLDEVLNRLAASAERIAENDREHLLGVCDRWRQARPQASIIEVIRQRTSTVVVGPADPTSLPS